MYFRYCHKLPEYDSVVPNALLYFLQQTLRVTKATKADVKRVYALKASLLTQNFQSSSTENLRQLLLSAVKSHLYLKCTEGIKLITFLVTHLLVLKFESSILYNVSSLRGCYLIKVSFQILNWFFFFSSHSVLHLSVRYTRASNRSSPDCRKSCHNFMEKCIIR